MTARGSEIECRPLLAPESLSPSLSSSSAEDGGGDGDGNDDGEEDVFAIRAFGDDDGGVVHGIWYGVRKTLGQRRRRRPSDDIEGEGEGNTKDGRGSSLSPTLCAFGGHRVAIIEGGVDGTPFVRFGIVQRRRRRCGAANAAARSDSCHEEAAGDSNDGGGKVGAETTMIAEKQDEEAMPYLEASAAPVSSSSLTALIVPEKEVRRRPRRCCWRWAWPITRSRFGPSTPPSKSQSPIVVAAEGNPARRCC